jgi:FMN phosphatase YigB (HAD superfamily)
MTAAQDQRLRAVLFDLDDTLLYDDMEHTFLPHYFAALTDYMRPLCAPEELMKALYAGTQAAIASQDPAGPTNEDTYAAVFATRLDRPWDEIRGYLMGFYETRYPALRAHTRSHPDARRAIETCLDSKYTVVIATNAIFPATAIQQRLSWAKIADLPYTLVTTYENMHTAKPSPAYYREIAGRIDVAPEQCLMVGNDVMRDIIPAQRTGMRTFLADTWMTNPDPEVRADGRGSLAEFIDWIEDGMQA